MAANDNLYGSKVGTYSSGGVITHTLFNTEFNAIANCFHATDGHTHDGTAGSGAPISKLNANTITIGTGASSNIVLNFNTDSNDGQITWVRASDYFHFSDDIFIPSSENIYFRDTNLYINSSTDGQLDLVADTKIKLTAPSIDLSGSANLGLGSDGSSLAFGADSDVTLTHVHDSGLQLNTANKLYFGTTDHFIGRTSILGSGEFRISSTQDIHLDNNTLYIGEDNNNNSTVVFRGDTNDGSFSWFEDENYFRFADDIMLFSTKKLYFNDTAVYINSSTDGQLDIVSDVLIKTSGGLATTPVTLTGAGGALAVDITESQMFLNTGSGTTTLTMAAGADGQQMRITMEVAGNNATMSASDGNLVTSQASSITWDAVGESVDFVYSASLSKWLIVNVHGATLS